MTEDEQREADLARLREHAKALQEHFGTTHIFCCREEEDGAVTHMQVGKGNFFSRYGQIRAWVLTEEEGFRETARQEEEE